MFKCSLNAQESTAVPSCTFRTFAQSLAIDVIIQTKDDRKWPQQASRSSGVLLFLTALAMNIPFKSQSHMTIR
ncbi:hypothetical protein SKAU_G00384090 [Synaphobranchus kaupii]|uniref:Uncharacterized protein n=1 Tax=Synaphobranchus kaupii TaxID=118154 RepID=A0A9Q1EE76_SYNKA|nr:hypothetical protein SKAU_G00384090 [Synaphobranchus kaupii]